MTRQENLEKRSAASDMEVVQQILDGDLNALELIMRRYNQRLYRIARGVVQNDMDAEDVVQDAYIQAYENLTQFQATGPLFVWLAKITLNEALMHLRSAKGARNSISFDDPLHAEEANHMVRACRLPNRTSRGGSCTDCWNRQSRPSPTHTGWYSSSAVSRKCRWSIPRSVLT